MKIGLQLWSIFQETEKNLLKTLEKVAKMGYEAVEFAGYFEHSAAEIKAKLQELGLEVAASHIPFERLCDEFDAVIAFEKELGNNYIVCPYATFETIEEWLSFAKELKIINQKILDSGLRFVYHNHAEEFQKFEDGYILDHLLKNVDMAEIDVYWAAFAGVEPVSYLQQYSKKTPLVHIKDMDETKDKSTEIGNGILDIEAIVKQAKDNGAEWLIVEQEAFDNYEPLTAVEIGINYLKQHLRPF